MIDAVNASERGKMKRVLIAGLLTAFLAGSLSGCGKPGDVEAGVIPTTPAATQTPEPTEEASEEIVLSNSQDLIADYTTVQNIPVQPGTYIAVVVKGLDTDYWKNVKKGAKAAIDDLNQALGYTGDQKIKMTFEGTTDTADVDSQINILDAVLAENPSVLCLSAIDMESCGPQLETAAENEIPVVVIDSGVENNLVTTSCATNNYAAAAEAAKKLCESIYDSGSVAVIAHQKTSQSSIDRVKGFTEEIAQNHPNVKIEQIMYENEDESVEEMVEAFLEIHPDVSAIFCTNEGVSKKTLEALEAAGAGEVKLVGFDAGKEQLEAVRDGREYGMISQNPYGMGYASLVAAARLSADLPTDQYISSGYQWIDSTNIDAEENQKYLYE